MARQSFCVRPVFFAMSEKLSELHFSACTAVSISPARGHFSLTIFLVQVDDLPPF